MMPGSTMRLWLGLPAWVAVSFLPAALKNRCTRKSAIAAWAWLFFGLHQLAAAAVEIVVLWAMILALVVMFWRRDRAAGVLLVPYLLWVTYAVTLSIGFAIMNPP
jgi:tryptophan-rich sensory protein